MKSVVFIVGLCCALGAGVAESGVPSDLEYKTARFYEDLGCRPERGGQQFDCGGVVNAHAPGACVYRSRRFRDGESLTEEVLTGACQLGCFCYARDNATTGSISCPEVDCAPEAYEERPGCVRTLRDINDCCMEQTCDTSNKVTCNFEGKTYIEGEIFVPESFPCMRCRCQENFREVLSKGGRTVDQGGSCLPVSCGVGLRSWLMESKVNKYCAPIFRGSNCCPTDWHCQNGKEKVMEAKAHKGSRPAPGQQQCRLGSLFLNEGDSVETGQPSIGCSCLIPPFVSCWRE